MTQLRRALTPPKTARILGTLLIAELALIPPVLLWATLKANEHHSGITMGSGLEASVLNAIGFHSIPMTVIVPAALASIAFWVCIQLEGLVKTAKSGQIPREIKAPGLHLAIIVVWAWTARMLLQHYGIDHILTAAAMALETAALVGIIWRMMNWRIHDDDPRSSMLGRMAQALPDKLKWRLKDRNHSQGSIR